MNPLPMVHFQVNTPCTDEQLGENIIHALSLGLPEADDAPMRSLHIVANGPSARHAPFGTFDGPTLALNGSIKLFAEKGLAPTYWAACDPQAIIADMLPKVPSRMTVYFVASKCDASVFRRLQGNDVRLWHIGDHELTKPFRAIKVASSVTLCALGLMRRLGFRHFEIWGWDGAYEGDMHHATDAPKTEPREGDIDLIVGAMKDETTGDITGGRLFHTNTTWALEAQDALTLLHRADYTVKIHGTGLINALMQAPKNA